MDPETQAKLIALLKKTFQSGQDSVAQLSDTQLLETVKFPFGDRMVTRYTYWQGPLYQIRNQDVEDELIYGQRVTERLSALGGMAESADGRPPRQVYDVFALFAPELQRDLLGAQAALRDALPGVNAALKAKKLPAIEPRPVELRAPQPIGN